MYILSQIMKVKPPYLQIWGLVSQTLFYSSGCVLSKSPTPSVENRIGANIRGAVSGGTLLLL